MSDMQPTPNESEETPFVPSPVSRRIWAWMGVVYVVILILLITYWIATNHFITGIFGILTFPFFGALCAQGVNNYRLCRQGQREGKPGLLLGSAIGMGLVSLSLLALGIFQLIHFFGGM